MYERTYYSFRSYGVDAMSDINTFAVGLGLKFMTIQERLEELNTFYVEAVRPWSPEDAKAGIKHEQGMPPSVFIATIAADLKGIVGDRLTLKEYAELIGQAENVDNPHQLGRKLGYNEAIDHVLDAIDRYCGLLTKRRSKCPINTVAGTATGT